MGRRVAQDPPSKSPTTAFSASTSPVRRGDRCWVGDRTHATGILAGSFGPVAHLLGAESVHLAYPTQVIFDSVTLGVNDGARIGIVGRNGDGKSSLLGLLTGELQPDSGRVTRRSG
ncbi:ATP-binding cassette domain-containing protein, partial [Mycobacterium marinum]